MCNWLVLTLTLDLALTLVQTRVLTLELTLTLLLDGADETLQLLDVLSSLLQAHIK